MRQRFRYCRCLESLEPRRVLAAAPIISEVMASNDLTLRDGFDKFPDWIELLNAGTMSLDLEEWHLTDDAGNLDKWTFPSVTLGPGATLVVFASGNGGEDPDGNLHTSFKLRAAGEFLALVEPDGTTIASQFTPEFPHQFTDVSYGFATPSTETVLVTSDNEVRVLIPDAKVDSAIGDTWKGDLTNEPFDDSLGEGWIAGSTGVGYTESITELLLLTSERSDSVVAYDLTSNTPQGVWADAGDGLDGPTGIAVVGTDVYVANEGSRTQGVDGELVRFDFDGTNATTVVDDLPGGVSGLATGPHDGNVYISANNQIIRYNPLTGSASPFNAVDVPGLPSLQSLTWGPDGNLYVADRQRNSGEPDSGAVLRFDVNGNFLGPFVQEDNFLVTGITFGPDKTGDNQLDLYLTNLNLDSVAVFAGPNDPNAGQFVMEVIPDDNNLLKNPQGIGFFEDELLVTSLTDETLSRYDVSGVAVQGQTATFSRTLLSEADGLSDPTYFTVFGGAGVSSDVIGTDVGAQLQGVNSSVYLRVPFAISDQSVLDSFASLSLDMQYDDGFVAYLNGVEVARRSAPAQLSYDAKATDERPPELVSVGETFNLSDHIDILRFGNQPTNILSIHGLNLSVNDDDFLIAPHLAASTAITVSDDAKYFFQATPDERNDDGLSTLGPLVVDQQHAPPQPTSTEDLVVTATVTDLLAATDTVTLFYRVMYGSDQSLPMVDDGTGDDAVPGDGVYTATISHTNFESGQMVRYYIRSVDTLGNSRRAPLFLDPAGSAEYFGTVVEPGISSKLDVFHWFAEDTNAAFGRTGTRASVFYHGTFYDNVFVAGRGKTTFNESPVQKRPLRFVFNTTELFQYSEVEKPVEEFRLGATYTDKSFIRRILSYETYREAGIPYSQTIPWRVELNGDFHQVAIFTEQLNKRYLDRNGLDRDGTLFQGTDKKFGDDEAFADFVEGTDPTNPDRDVFLFDYIDLPSAISYVAVNTLIQDDDSYFDRGNYYVYQDPTTQLWTALPWDKDLTLGRNSNPIPGTGILNDIVWADVDSHSSLADDRSPSHPFLGALNHRGASGAPRPNTSDLYLADAIFASPVTREMYLRRLRTLMDDTLGFPLTPAEERFYDRRTDELFGAIEADAELDRGVNSWYGEEQSVQEAVDILKSDYFATRRTHLFVTHNIDNLIGSKPDVAGIPHGQVGNPPIGFGEVVFNPSTMTVVGPLFSGRQDDEYIELTNANDVAVDISGWRLSGDVEFTFAQGTVIPAGSSLYATPSVSAFRSRASSPTGGEGLFVQGNYTGRLSNRGESLTLSAADGEVMTTLILPAMPSEPQQFLRVSEVMYNPADPTPEELAIDPSFTSQDFEFIELMNIAPGDVGAPLDLRRVKVVEGIEFAFLTSDVVTLNPGERVLVVSNQNAFDARYGNSHMVAGEFDGNLDNAGERIKVDDFTNSTIVDFEYNDRYPWSEAGDAGASLELIAPLSTPVDEFSKHYRWQGSVPSGGTPGTATSLHPGVVINEVLTNTDDLAEITDAIELHNVTDREIDISGWFLSDTPNDLRKFQIPADTFLAPLSYLVFDETDFNPTPGTPAVNHFALDGDKGDDIWLTFLEADQIQFADDVHFGASVSGESFGRMPNGDGRLAPLITSTLGNENPASRVGPLIISEIQYHPTYPSPQATALDRFVEVDDLEFLELHNPTNTAVDLTEWRMRGGIDIDFDAGTTVGAGETVVVISFNPDRPDNVNRSAAFRAHYGVGPDVQLFGGYQGNLSNSGESIRLRRPGGSPLGRPDVTRRLLEDEVLYDDRGLWPADTDGLGASLQRRDATSYGKDPASWNADIPSPGIVRFLSDLPGDFDGNGIVQAADVDLLFSAVNSGDQQSQFDLNGDSFVETADIDYLVMNILGTRFGDINLDGRVQFDDFVTLANNFDNVAIDRTWVTGDMDGDGKAGFSDFVLLSNQFGFDASDT